MLWLPLFTRTKHCSSYVSFAVMHVLGVLPVPIRSGNASYYKMCSGTQNGTIDAKGGQRTEWHQCNDLKIYHADR